MFSTHPSTTKVTVQVGQEQGEVRFYWYEAAAYERLLDDKYRRDAVNWRCPICKRYYEEAIDRHKKQCNESGSGGRP